MHERHFYSKSSLFVSRRMLSVPYVCALYNIPRTHVDHFYNPPLNSSVSPSPSELSEFGFRTATILVGYLVV